MVNGNDYHVKYTVQRLRLRKGADKINPDCLPGVRGDVEGFKLSVWLVIRQFGDLAGRARLAELINVCGYDFLPDVLL